LRERQEDIPLLVQSFTEKYKLLNTHGQKNVEVSDEALGILQSYSWPGNVRELENIIQQAIIFAKDGLITSETLPPEILENAIKPSLTKAELQDEKTDAPKQLYEMLNATF